MNDNPASQYFRPAANEKTVKITGYAFPTDEEWRSIVARIYEGNATEADIAIYQTIRWWQGDTGN